MAKKTSSSCPSISVQSDVRSDEQTTGTTSCGLVVRRMNGFNSQKISTLKVSLGLIFPVPCPGKAQERRG